MSKIVKYFSFDDIIFKEQWHYKNDKSGYSHKSGIIPGVLFYTAISGIGTYEDIEKGAAVLEQIYIDGDFKNKSFVRIIDLGNHIKATFRARQEYLKIIKGLYSKYNYHPKITYICNAKPWITTTLKFAKIFLIHNYYAVSTIDKAFKHINGNLDLTNITHPQTTSEEKTITISEKEINKIIEMTEYAIWGIKDKELDDYTIPEDSSLSQLFHSIKIMLEDNEEIIANEILIAEERSRNLKHQKILTEISLLFTKGGKFDKKIETALELIGEFTNASSLYIFENSENDETLNTIYRWNNKNIKSQKREILEKRTYKNTTSWKNRLSNNGIIYSTNIFEFDNSLVDSLDLHQLKSVFILPIYIKKKMFGFFELSECKEKKGKSNFEKELLKTIANIFSTAFEQRETQNNLEKTENIFKAISNSANDGIILMNNLGNISYWNDAAKTIFGYSQEEVLGKNLHELLTPSKYREQQNAAFLHFQNTGKGNALGKTLELEAIRRNGETFSVELSLSPLKINAQWHAVGMVRDITNRKKDEAIIRENLKQIEVITANIPNIIWKSEVDASGKLVNNFISDKADDFLKVPTGTIKNSWEEYYKYVKPEYHEILNKQIANSILNVGTLLSVDYEVIKGDGTNAWFSSKWHAQLDDGKLTIFGSIIDITERKNIGKKLEEANKLFRKISENYPNSFILIFEKNFTVSFASGQTFKNKGVDPNFYIGLSVNDIFENEALFVKEKYKNAFNGETTSFELFINNKYQYHKASSLLSENGKITKIIVVVEDITIRKEMENTLRESKEKYSALLNNLNDVVFEIDNDGNILFVNKIAEKVFERSLEAISEKPCYELYSIESKKILYRTYNKLLLEYSEGNLVNLNVHLELTTNNEKTVFVKTTPIIDSNDKIIGHRGIARDISDFKNAEIKLKESEEKFRILFEKSDDALLVLENEKVIDCNQSALKMLGYKNKTELLNTHLSQISPAKQPDGSFSYQKANEMVSIAIKKGTHHFEWIHLRANSNEFPVDVWFTAIPYQNRKIIHVVWRDISERKKRDREIEQYQNHLEELVTKRTEDLIHYQRKLEDMVEERTIQFQQSEERYRILTENSDDVIMRFDKDMRYLYVNSSITKVLDKLPEELIGKTNKELELPSELYTILDNGIESVFRRKNKNRIEFKLANNIWLDWTLVPEFNDKGKVESVLGSARDITERKKVEDKLKKQTKDLENSNHELEKSRLAALNSMQEANIQKQKAEKALSDLEIFTLELKKLSRVVEEAPLSVVITDIDGKIEYANPHFTKITGYSSEEVKGKTMSIFKTGFHKEKFYERLWGTITSQAIWKGELFNKKKNGEKYWEKASISPIINEDGKITHFVGIKEDITEKKKRELELRKAKLSAESSTKVKSQFLASMSHEIRTPMNAIIGLSHLAKNAEPSPKLMDYISKIETSAQSLLRIINDILDFSKIEANKLTLENINFNLETLLSSTAGLVSQKVYEKGLELILDIAPNVPLNLVGDPLRVRQIITNFLSNAVKFTEKGEIIVTITMILDDHESSEILFAVQDSGIGIKEDEKEKLFNAFQQADTSTTRKFGGTGLGLVISKSIAKLMNGDIWFESEENKGSTFYFAASFKKQNLKYNNISASFNELKGMKVLLYHKNLTSGKFLTKKLESFSFDVSFAKTEEEVFNLVKEETYSLILIDSGINHNNFLKSLQKSSNLEISVIVLSKISDIKNAEKFSNKLKKSVVLIKPVLHSDIYNKIVEIFDITHNTKITESQDCDKEKLQSISNSLILVVEDNKINQQVIDEILQSINIKVEIANNGIDAIEMVKNSGSPSKYSLILMDIQMPEMDGFTATGEILKLKQYSRLPIIAMTADAMEGVKEKCIATGMSDFLTKPVEPNKIFRTLLKWIKPNNQNIPHSIEANSISEKIKIPQIDGLNISEGLKYVGGDKILFLNILQKFFENNKDFESKIDKALKNGNRDEAIRLIHTLKSNAALLGMSKLQNIADNAQNELIKNDKLKVEHFISEIVENLTPIINALEKIKLTTTKHKQNIIADVKEKLIDLKALLELYDSDAIALVNDIGSIKGFEEEIRQLRKETKNYQFERALAVLSKILGSK